MATEVPRLQQAAVIENPGPAAKVSIRSDVPLPSPGPTEVLVKVHCSGVCGSEVRVLLGYGSYSPTAGHEGVGVVVQVGAEAPNTFLHKRVGVKWLYSACGNCSVCRRGFAHCCANQVNTGRQVPGTLQQYAVADSRYLTLIPEAVANEVAAPLLCAGLTMMGAVSKLDGHLARGDWVAVLGSGGGLGHLGVQIAARIRGLKVIGIDAGESKRTLSMDSGASNFFDYTQEDIEKSVQDLTGEGAHAVIISSGSEDAFNLAPKLVRNMGHIVCVGLPRNDFNLPISATLCSARALTISGVSVGSEEQMQELLQHAATGLIVPRVETLDFSQTPEIFEQLRTGNVTGRLVVKLP